jgi:hypothetical protein
MENSPLLITHLRVVPTSALWLSFAVLREFVYVGEFAAKELRTAAQ